MTKTSFPILEKIIIYLVLLLANLRASVFIFLFPDTSKPLSAAWVEILLWVLSAGCMVYLLFSHNRAAFYLGMWRRNWLLALFIGLAILSVFWSVAPTSTVFRFLELFFATVLAAYFGIRFLPENMMDILFWFGAVLFIVSIALVYGAPPTGTMYWEPFHGAWRGVFWHRNHLASVAALLNAIYLCRVLIAIQTLNRNGLLDGFFYLISLLILFYARSATGYIILIILNAFVMGAWIWLKLQARLKKWHYILLVGVGTLAVTIVLSNLRFVFGLFNRSSTMTGRLPLWEYLFAVARQRFWTGHGFGAVWTLDAFREQAMLFSNWAAQPLIADNGFLDIFLHLGIIGVLILLALLVLFAVRAVRFALQEKSIPGFFPLLILVYSLFANLSFSLFAETEVFVWFLIVASLFMTTGPVDENNLEINHRRAES
jgi:exopolysaccharide production protein ExoQ